jgi:hypothetical protein
MDKERIHIDDLIRGQFAEREEEVRPGAWFQMRELLDQQMPVGSAPVLFNWRRFAGAMVLVSLVTALSVGGYRYVQQYAAEEEAMLTGAGKEIIASEGGASEFGDVIHAPEASVMPERSGSVIAPKSVRQAEEPIAGAQYPDLPPTDEGRVGVQTPAQAAGSRATGEAAGSRGGVDPARGAGVNANPSDRTTVAANGATPNAPSSGTSPETTRTNLANNPVEAAGAPAVQTKQAHAAEVAGTSASTAAAAPSRNRPANARNEQPTGDIPSAMTQTAPETAQNPGRQVGAGSRSLAAESTASAKTTPARSSAPVQSATPGSAKAAGSGTGVYANTADTRRTATTLPGSGNAGGKTANVEVVLHRDTVEKINLVYRTVIDPLSRTRSVQVDTASIERMVIERRIEVAAVAPPRTAPAKAGKKASTMAVPAATPEAAPRTEQKTVASARKARRGGWDPQRFEEMFLDAKFNLSQAQFYPGITGGINAMFSGGTFIPGIQLGFNGEIVFNDRWSVMTELKYINRFSNNKTIEDNYVTAPFMTGSKAPVPVYNPNTSAVEAMVYTRDSILHSFNFSTLGTLNLPISIRYAVNRFFMAAGIDLVHHFRINAEEVEQTVRTLRDTIPVGQAIPASWEQGEPSIRLNDLAGRFGLGYLVGVGYKVTPDLSLDLRMSHMLMDNARTKGSSKVSDQLFRIPNVQFSLSYRLGNRQPHP